MHRARVHSASPTCDHSCWTWHGPCVAWRVYARGAAHVAPCPGSDAGYCLPSSELSWSFILDSISPRASRAVRENDIQPLFSPVRSSSSRPYACMSSLPMGTQYATAEHAADSVHHAGEGRAGEAGSAPLELQARHASVALRSLAMPNMHIPAVVATTANVRGSRSVRYHLGKMLYLMPSLSNTYAAAGNTAPGEMAARASGCAGASASSAGLGPGAEADATQHVPTKPAACNT